MHVLNKQYFSFNESMYFGGLIVFKSVMLFISIMALTVVNTQKYTPVLLKCVNHITCFVLHVVHSMWLYCIQNMTFIYYFYKKIYMYYNLNTGTYIYKSKLGSN